MKRTIILTIAAVLVALVTFLMFYYGRMEAQLVRQHIEAK